MALEEAVCLSNSELWTVVSRFIMEAYVTVTGVEAHGGSLGAPGPAMANWASALPRYSICAD
jgi:hypothetical protein